MTVTHLTSGAIGDNQPSYTSAPITPTAGKVILAFVEGTGNNADAGAGSCTVSGCGLTWTELAFGESLQISTRIFRGTGTPSTGGVTFTWPGNLTGCCWSICEVDGTDITQAKGENGDGNGANSRTVTFATAPTGTVVAGFGAATDAVFASADTQVGTASHNSPANRIATFTREGGSVDSTASWSGGAALATAAAVEVESGGGATDLVIASAAHGHTADNVTLVHVEPANLTIDAATHAHAADVLTLTQVHNLTVADTTHAHAADTVPLEQTHILTIDDTGHGHTAEHVTLSTETALTIHDATHAHTAGTPTLTQAHTLAIDDALHTHTVDALTLTAEGALLIADAAHAHAADTLALTQVHQFAIDSALHGHAAANVVLIDPTAEPVDITVTIGAPTNRRQTALGAIAARRQADATGPPTTRRQITTTPVVRRRQATVGPATTERT